jgi:hypothetical protein
MIGRREKFVCWIQGKRQIERPRVRCEETIETCHRIVTDCKLVCWSSIPDCGRDISLFAGPGIHEAEFVLRLSPESKAAGKSNLIFPFI